jgi:drug/metabolite transporter (DMT)-like permease
MSRRGWLLFALMCVIWGIPYLLIRVAVRDFSPGTLVFARTAPAVFLLLPWAIYRGALRGLLPYWRPLALYTAVEVALPWLLLAKAEQRLPSALTGLLVAAVPLIGALLGYLLREDDRLDVRRMFGLLIGFGGVVTLVGVDVAGANLGAVGEVALVAVCYATGPLIIVRRLSHLPSIGVVTVSLALTALAYAPYGLTHWPSHISAKAGWSIVGLSVVCTAAAFLVFFALIAEVGPARAVVITYVNPVVAITLGVLLLNEKLTLGLALGAPLVLLGSVLATARSRTAVTGPEMASAELCEDVSVGR